MSPPRWEHERLFGRASRNRGVSETRRAEINAAVEALRRREPDIKDIYVIAGFAAYVTSCSPAAMRMGKPHLAASVQATAEILDARGLVPPSPEELGGRSLTDLLDDGSVQITIDEKYPQAIGISQIEGRVHNFGNAVWDVMFADASDAAFVTSDFPIALGPSYDNRVVSKTVPLAPDVAIRIHPQLRERGKKLDFSFPTFALAFAASSEKRFTRSTGISCVARKPWSSSIKTPIGLSRSSRRTETFNLTPSSRKYLPLMGAA